MTLIRTPQDLGNTIRSRRKELGWDQANLAKQIGVTRQWVIDIEKGKPRAELALALRALNVLGLTLNADIRAEKESAVKPKTLEPKLPTIDINEIVDRSRSATHDVDRLHSTRIYHITTRVKDLLSGHNQPSMTNRTYAKAHSAKGLLSSSNQQSRTDPSKYTEALSTKDLLSRYNRPSLNDLSSYTQALSAKDLTSSYDETNLNDLSKPRQPITPISLTSSANKDPSQAKVPKSKKSKSAPKKAP